MNFIGGGITKRTRRTKNRFSDIAVSVRGSTTQISDGAICNGAASRMRGGNNLERSDKFIQPSRELSHSNLESGELPGTLPTIIHNEAMELGTIFNPLDTFNDSHNLNGEESMQLEPGLSSSSPTHTLSDRENPFSNSSDFDSPRNHLLGRWKCVAAIIFITGSVRFTREQYNAVRLVLSCVTPIISENSNDILDSRKAKNPELSMLPSYSSLQRVWRPLVCKHLGVRGRDVIYNFRTAECRRQHPTSLPVEKDEIIVRLVPVSEYARMDVGFYPFQQSTTKSFYEETLGSTEEQFEEQGTSIGSQCGFIDDMYLVANREECYTNRAHIHAWRDIKNESNRILWNRAYVGDVVSLNIRGTAQLSTRIIQRFAMHNDRAITSVGKISGKITAIRLATVGNGSDNCQDSERNSVGENDKFLLKKLCSQLSSDTTIVSSRKRNINRRQQLFGVGDILAIMRPLEATDLDMCIVIVNRFHVGEGEYDEQIFCLRNVSNLQINPFDYQEIEIDENGNTISDIRDVKIISTLYENTGDAGRMSASNTGWLNDGRKYFVYRFLLFWDGFRVGDVSGNSLEGVYLIPLNLPPSSRNSSSAVRVLSLLPKGIPTEIVLDELVDDIRRGMIEGFEDYDALGEKTTIFLDLVGCIGDTPALNGLLDVKGHNAIACCHLCRFRRLQNQEIEIGKGKQSMKIHNPRYMGTYPHGGVVFASRSIEVHKAIHSAGIGDDIAKRLGIKLGWRSPFWNYAEMFQSISNQVPLTSLGASVVPSCLDAYRCMIIGPDHLVFGLAKNSLNAVLALLPNQQYITLYEKIAIHYMQAARVATPKRLVNHDEKKLLSMTISEIFALLVVSEEAFRFGVLVMESSENERDSSSISSTCDRAISIVGSLSRITSRIWFTPRIDEDETETIKTFYESRGAVYFQQTQQLIATHLHQMRRASSFKEEEIREYKRLISNRSTHATAKRKKLEKLLRERSVLCKILDTPNVHRLLEFAHMYLPMIGSGVRVSELEFEKCHQALKRAIENSNNRNSHLQAMSAAISNDWQGRISMLFNRNESLCSATKLSLFRLLTGRESVAARNGVLSVEDEKAVLDSIGPQEVVWKLLQMQGRKVFNDTTPFRGHEYWEGVPFAHDRPPSTSIILQGTSPFPFNITGKEGPFLNQLSKRYESLISSAVTLLNALHGKNNWRHIERAKPRHHHFGNQKKYAEIKNGDVIQCLVFPPSAYSPILNAQVSVRDNLNTAKHHFYILFLIEVESSCGAVVLPCIEDHGSSNENNNVDSEQNQSTKLQIHNLPPMRITQELNDLKLLQMTNACKRIYIQHQCTALCLTDPSSSGNVVFNCNHPLESQFFVRDRHTGLPPRAA